MIPQDDYGKAKGTQGQFTIDRRKIALNSLKLHQKSQDKQDYWPDTMTKKRSRKHDMEETCWKKGTLGKVMLGRRMESNL